MAEIAGGAQGSAAAVMAALRVTVSCPGRDAARSGAAQSRDPETGTIFADAWAPAQQRTTAPDDAAHRRGGAALRPGHESEAKGESYISSRPSSNGSSPPTRFFFFERCQTTPGKPFSGTSGSPV